MSKKLERGRPAKARLDVDSIKEKLALEFLRRGKDCANNLPKYFETLEKFALGEKGSDTNQISSAKYMIEMAKDYLEQYSEEGEQSSGESKQEEAKKTGTDNSDSPIISLIPRKSKEDE